MSLHIPRRDLPLPLELVAMVVGKLIRGTDENPEYTLADLRNCRLVSRMFYICATEPLFRNLRVTFPDSAELNAADQPSASVQAADDNFLVRDKDAETVARAETESYLDVSNLVDDPEESTRAYYQGVCAEPTRAVEMTLILRP